MGDGFSLVCPACGQAADLSSGLTPNEYGQLICANCGGEIPVPLAAPDDSPGDITTRVGESTTVHGDMPTSVDPPGEVEVAEAGDDSADSLPGDSGAPRYVEQETIGKGGMGEIVLCVEQNTLRQVAMKRMLPTAVKHARQRARFVEEAQVTAQLEHPNIVPVHELGRDSRGAIYFTMKLVKGRSLSEILNTSRDGDETHSLGEMLGIFLKVCDGVAFAHSRGVVHRDLKPANIMVGDFGEVLVMDWGIARILGRDEIADEEIVQSSRQDTDSPGLDTRAGTTMGSPSYMPPEQAAGEIDKIDHRSDIYSLGAILYNILTLKRPVEGRTAEAIMNKVVRGNLHPPEQRAPERGIPRELSAVAMKCLAKYRRDRYASVPDLQRDISLYLEGRSVSAAPDTFSQALIKLVRRNKGISLAVAAAAVILIALGTVFVIRLKAERDVAVRERQAAQAARDLQQATALASSKRFAMQAIRAAETGRPEEALRRVEDAEAVALRSPWGPYARGMFARTNNDYATAADWFRKALKVDPDHSRSKVALPEALLRMGDLTQAQKLLANVSGVADWRALLNAGRTLYDTRRWKGAKVVFTRAIELMEKEKDASKGLIAATAREVREKIIIATTKAACEGFADEISDLPPEEQVKRVDAKFQELNGTKLRQIADVEIKNSKWIRATLSQYDTRFLDPLRGLPLQYLKITYTRVSDLEPLKGMPLTSLDCLGTRVSSLKPLVEGMPLTYLNCYETRVSDLSPLKGKPLKELLCGGTRITDLSPLKGMPLESLHFPLTRISDLEPLADLPLTYLECSNTPISDLGPLKDLHLTGLGCDGTRVKDLSPLKGMPLTHLRIARTKVTDISPLKGMPLTRFDLQDTRVTDLAVLKGMPLDELNLYNTKIGDLSPLEGMPLRLLWIHGTKVTDLTPLAGMKLEKFTFVPGNITKGIDTVRRMQSIQHIGADNTRMMDPEEFWKKYDAGEFE